MEKQSYNLDKLFYISDTVEYKSSNSSFKESLNKILEALYMQKIKESNSDFLPRLSFYEILNFPSLVSEAIFNSLIKEPREYIKLDEFVDGLSLLFDKHIDFEYDSKTKIPKIYEILFKIFSVKKIQNNNSENENISKNNFKNFFTYEFDLETFNKILSSILLTFFVEAKNFNIEEFLPFCEEIKLIVKKTFSFSSLKNLNVNQNLNNSTINLNITSNTKQNKDTEQEFSCSNLNINLNNQSGSNMNFNMNMNTQMNLNLNINNLSDIVNNLPNNNCCTQCKMCLDCSKLNNISKNSFNLNDFVLCLQNNSKLLFILLLLFYSVSPINQKLIYLLMKNPTSKIIDDECDFSEEEEKTNIIQMVPDSVKKVNIDEIKTNNSRLMSENSYNSSINDSRYKRNSNADKFLGNVNIEINNNFENKKKKIKTEYVKEPNGFGRIVFDLNSEDTDSLGTSTINNIEKSNISSKFHNSRALSNKNVVSSLNNQKSNITSFNIMESNEVETKKNFRNKNFSNDQSDSMFSVNSESYYIDNKNVEKDSGLYNIKDGEILRNLKNKNFDQKKNLQNFEKNNLTPINDKQELITHIIVYRDDDESESCEDTNNNIFDTRFKNSFDNIKTIRDDTITDRFEKISNFNKNLNYSNNYSRINTKNSLYNEFNDFLNEKNKNKGNLLPNNNDYDNRSRKMKIAGNNFSDNKNKGEIKNENPFAFEDIFSEIRTLVEKRKISKDFIFDKKKCENFSFQSKNNKNFSFKNFNFNLENDWLIKNIKDIYFKLNENKLSEIKNFNPDLSFLTLFYQFNTDQENNSHNNKSSKVKILSSDEILIKEKSKNLTKTIADIIDEYLVIFTFRNNFESNFIHSFMKNKKNNEIIENEENLILNNKNNKLLCTNTYNLKETGYGIEDKVTNYKLNTNDSQDFVSKSKINLKKDSLTTKADSDIISIIDIYESNDFFSINLKLIINLRSSIITPLDGREINGIKIYPLKINQDDNCYFIFFDNNSEREILIKYHKEKILNINPIRNYDSNELISKNKSLEFTKGLHKETKEQVEIKKYMKKNIKSEKLLKEINSLRDLSIVHKFFAGSKIPKILFFENSEEMYVVYENCENDPIKFIFMNPKLKITKDISKYSMNIKKMKELKNMLEMLSISLSPDNYTQD